MKKILFTTRTSKLENWLLEEVMEFLPLEIFRTFINSALNNLL